MSRVVVVTGASYGVGRAISAAFESVATGSDSSRGRRTTGHSPPPPLSSQHLAYGAIVGGFTEGV